MIIGTSQKLMQFGAIPEIKENNILLKRVPYTKSLGLFINETLSWVNHIEYISVKIKRGIGVLKRAKPFIPKHLLKTLYINIIEPYFRYCNTVWGQCQDLLLDKLQTLQNKTARIVAGKSYKEADHNKLLQELGWLNVKKLIRRDSGISMLKINKGDAPEAIFEMFRHNDYSYNTRGVASDIFLVNMVHLSIGKTVISYIAPELWNSIPTMPDKIILQKHQTLYS